MAFGYGAIGELSGRYSPRDGIGAFMGLASQVTALHCVKTSKQAAICKSGRESSPETGHAGTLCSALGLRTVKNKCLLFKTSSLYGLIAAQTKAVV